MLTHIEYQEQINELLAIARAQLDETEKHVVLPPRMWYPVIVFKKDGSFDVGTVVTRLSLEDWAKVHKVKVQLSGNTRPALHEETTDLL